ncbi:MAG: RNA polymerase sigma factor, partial [Phycisphaerae bacterium]
MSQPKVPTSKPPSDGELLVAFAVHRQEAAFTEVVHRHGGMVLAVCRSVLGNTSDAEDAAQAVFLTLAQKAHASSVQTHLVGWLHRVAWYVAARGAEAKAIRRRHEQEAAHMRKDLHPAAGEPIQLEALHAGLVSLPEKYRVPLILHHLEGRSQEETAALMGCSVG